MSFETEIPLSTCEGIHTVYLVDKPEKDDPKFHIVTASRKQLESFFRRSKLATVKKDSSHRGVCRAYRKLVKSR